MIDKEAARRKLEDRRETLVTRTDKIQQNLRRLPDSDSQERVTERENDQVLEHLNDTERVELNRVSRALQRLEAGVYEECERCGQSIQPARLEAIPETAVCVECA